MVEPNSQYSPQFDDEDELQEWVSMELEKYGWDVRREVRPVDSDYRADILAVHDTWGTVGIECKYMKSPRCGSKFGQAIKQIVGKYRGEEYRISIDEYGTVNKWAVCPYFYGDSHEPQITAAMREVLCRFGIGLVKPSGRMKIDFGYSSSETKIKIDDDGAGEYGDLERIEEAIEKKKGLVDKKPTKQTCQYSGGVKPCSVEAHDTVELGKYQIHLCKHHIDKFDREKHEIEEIGE